MCRKSTRLKLMTSRKKTPSTMRVLLCTKFCTICAWQPARVVNTEGHIRSLTRPVTVAELLKQHPHHFLCEPSPAGPLFHSPMLPPDMELQEGRLYLLLPLPRLLPHLSSGGTTFCPCFQENTEDHGNKSDFKRWFVRKYQRHLVSTMKVAKVVRSVVRLGRQVLPERVKMRLSFHKLDSNLASKDGDSKSFDAVQVQMCATARNRWRPGLECISEVDLLMTGLLRHDSDLLMR